MPVPSFPTPPVGLVAVATWSPFEVVHPASMETPGTGNISSEEPGGVVGVVGVADGSGVIIVVVVVMVGAADIIPVVVGGGVIIIVNCVGDAASFGGSSSETGAGIVVSGVGGFKESI